jgi:hypothetical protein
MVKLSRAQVIGLVKESSAVIRRLSEDNRELQALAQEMHQKLASYQRRDVAEQIALGMQEKGLLDAPFQEKVAQLLQDGVDLDATARAVDMVTPQMKVAFAIGEERSSGVGGDAASAFANALLAGDGELPPAYGDGAFD